MDRLGTSTAVAAAALLLGSAAAVAGGPWGAQYFPNVPLTTQDGTVVHFYDDLLKGKAVVINLIYTRCSASCPLETAKLAQVQRLLGDRVGKDATGEWMRNSAVENPKFLAAMMSDFFGWRNGKPVRTYAAAAAIPGAGKGEYLFNTRCAACHGIGKGDGLGPDLLNVTTLRERAWLSRYLAEPDRMLAEGDPLATALV